MSSDKVLIDKCSFSIHFWLVSAHCVNQSFLSYTFFSILKTENFYISATECLRQRGQNETKSNVDKNMRTYLLCKKKGMSSVYEKITKKCQ